MAKNKGKKKEQGNDILENPEAIAERISKTEEFFSKNTALTTTVLIAIIVVVGGIFGFRYYKNVQNDEALSESFQAQFYFEKDSLELALRGDGINLGFVDVVNKYGDTKAGNLANFYAGAIFLKQQKYDLALLYLQDFETDDLLVQARAYGLLGDIFMEQSNFEEAIKYYQQASSYNPNAEFTPVYLVKSAVAFEKAGNVDKAKESYQTIIDKYSKSSEVQNAKKNLARIGG